MTSSADPDYPHGPEKLVAMANQIARFFHLYPEQAAVEGIREHLSRFWNRKMRADLRAHCDATGFAGVDPRVKLAVQGLD